LHAEEEARLIETTPVDQIHLVVAVVDAEGSGSGSGSGGGSGGGSGSSTSDVDYSDLDYSDVDYGDAPYYGDAPDYVDAGAQDPELANSLLAVGPAPPRRRLRGSRHART
jgi:hypothetical protein